MMAALEGMSRAQEVIEQANGSFQEDPDKPIKVTSPQAIALEGKARVVPAQKFPDTDQ
jgi:hypothetical protein